MNASLTKTNLIHRLVLDAVYAEDDNGYAFQTQLNAVCKEKVIPAIDATLDRFSMDSTLIIDRIDLDLGVVTPTEISLTLPSRVTSLLSDRIGEYVVSHDAAPSPRLKTPFALDVTSPHEASEISGHIMSREERAVALFEHYLIHGFLPWWGKDVDHGQLIEQIESLVDADPHIMKNVTDKISLLSNRAAFSRLVRSLSDHALEHILENKRVPRDAVNPASGSISPDVEKVIEGNPDPIAPEEIFGYSTFLQSARTKENDTEHSLKNHDREIAEFFIPALRIDESMASPVNNGNQRRRLRIEHLTGAHRQAHLSPQQIIEPDTYHDAALAHGVRVLNSGIVIASAFLHMLFSRLKWVDESGFIDTHRQCKAVRILQYISSGALDAHELHLPLLKILCGMQIWQSVNGVKLSAEEMQEADDLLVSLMTHWGVLKNTSVANLRTSFFQRPGILENHDDNWQLKVERRAYDILLDKLPWTISRIKFSWMPKQLVVEW